MTGELSDADLEHLMALCNAGRVFEVQDWVRQGNPVRARPDSAHTRRGWSPLHLAMERGFHSLVQVLLEGGAPTTEGYYVALDHAVELRRTDLAALLLQHGADIRDVSMRYVLETWQAEMVELVLSHGASLVHDKPIAWALIHKVRPALGLLKRLAPAQPELMQQANLALRHHAREGNAKWVALMLWVGADPWAGGPHDIEEELDEDADADDYPNAVELLVSRGHIEVLKQKKSLIMPDPAQPMKTRLLESACHADDAQVLSLLIERGHSPRSLPDHGTSAITWLLHSMTWDFAFYRPSPWSRVDLGPERARERMRMLHILVAYGGQWLPDGRERIADLRRSLLKLQPPYILEFVWLMQRYGAARRCDVVDLLRTPAIRRFLSDRDERVNAMVNGIPEDPGRNDVGIDARQSTV
jgi:hypothetical protein